VEGDGSGWRGWPKADIPAYSTLERHPDDYFRYRESVGRTRSRSKERSGRSLERDEVVKFYGYGDHSTSGIEIKPKLWSGGETITDPNYIKKYNSIKPRRFFYSPIGDGVVAADGVEMKRGPPDLTPRISVRHERFVERGKGQPGHRLYEHLWDEGGDGPEEDDGGRRGDGGFPPPRGRGGDGGPRGPPKRAAADDGGPRRAAPAPRDDGDRGDDGGPRRGSGGPPMGDGGLGDGGGGPRPGSALSTGTDGRPREGWSITFISNPRELINQYANETSVNIFDLEDHTPKTVTTVTESITPVPGSSNTNTLERPAKK